MAAIAFGASHRTTAPPPPGIEQIDTIVVIYAENRSFDGVK